MLSPGEEVDRYTVEAWVGSGAMADVYRVRHSVLGTPHALKVIRTATMSARVSREARAQASVHHPNIVHVQDVFPVDGRMGILMDWVAGSSLADRLDVGPLPDPEPVARLIAAGLAAIHAAGFVHRDLKPANVLLDEIGTPRIADFGLVKLVSGHDALRTHAGSLMGSPAYMAPEQTLDSASVGPAADVWAFGVLVYELITGSQPFLGSDVAETLDQVRAGHWTLPRNASPVLARVLIRCLVADPDARAQDGRAVHALFGAADASVHTWSDEVTVEIAGRGPKRPVDNLPAYQGDLFGRAEALGQLDAAALAGARILTVHGPGGAGKTRLAIAWADAAIQRFPGGVWFCDLASATQAEDVSFAVAGALGVPLASGDGVEAQGQTGRALAARGRAILLLDNVEQVVVATADAVRRWRAMAPHALFVVTSRERLQMDGERVVDVCALSSEDAVALFSDRARVADSRFDAVRHAAVVTEVVHRLDCMPLAIELAAARARVLPPAELLKRFDAGLGVLKSGRRDIAARQSSVEAAVAWSWDLLSGPEQHALATLSCFRGPFALADAEGVLADADALDHVEALADKSLLRRSCELTMRFAMYALVRSFTTSRRDDVAPEAGRLFVQHWARRGAELVDELRTARGGGPAGTLRLETDNLLSAYELALDLEPALALVILESLEMALQLDAGQAGARYRATLSPEALERLIAAQTTPEAAARARVRRIELSGPVLGRERCRQELDIIERSGLPPGDPAVCVARAQTLALEGKNEEALEQLLLAANTWTARGQARSPLGRAVVGERQRAVSRTFFQAQFCGRDAEWGQQSEAALGAARISGNRWAEALLLMHSIGTRIEAGELPEAERRALRVIEIGTDMAVPYLVDTNLGNLGGVYWQSGRIDAAEVQFRLALERAVGAGAGRHEAQWRKMLARVHLARGEDRQAADQWERANLLAAEEREPLRSMDFALVGATIAAMFRQLDTALERLETALRLLPAG